MSLPSHGITVKFSPSRGNYRGYRGITAFPVTEWSCSEDSVGYTKKQTASASLKHSLQRCMVDMRIGDQLLQQNSGTWREEINSTVSRPSHPHPTTACLLMRSPSICRQEQKSAFTIRKHSLRHSVGRVPSMGRHFRRHRRQNNHRLYSQYARHVTHPLAGDVVGIDALNKERLTTRKPLLRSLYLAPILSAHITQNISFCYYCC